jgi:hypothetical protein
MYAWREGVRGNVGVRVSGREGDGAKRGREGGREREGERERHVCMYVCT